MRLQSKAIFTIILLMTLKLYSQVYSDITYSSGTTIDIGSGADVCANNIYINGTFSGSGTICTGALPVTLLSFTSAVEKNNVTLSWVTETELNNSGFDVERKEIKEGSQWKKIAFAPGGGTTQGEKHYSLEDKKLKTGDYNYRLKQIDYNGNYEYFDLVTA